MLTFNPKNSIERGYSSDEIKDIEIEMENRKCQWNQMFKDNVEHLMVHADMMKPNELARYAQELTDIVFDICETPIEGRKL